MSAYEAFSNDFHAYFTADPNVCVNMGVDARLGDLPDPSPAAGEARVVGARALLARLAAFDRSGLDFEQSLDLDLARLKLESELLFETYTFNGRTRAQQCPRAGDEIADGIFLMFINDPRPAAARLENITDRVEKVPAYIEALLARTDTPIQRWVDIDVEKVEGLPELFATVRGWSEQEGWPEHGRLVRACAAAEAALTDYLARLKAMPTTTALHLDKDIAAAITRSRGLEPSLDEIHGFARQFLADIDVTLNALRDTIAPRYDLPADISLVDLHAFLNDRFKVQIRPGHLEDVLTRYEAEREKVLAFIKERDLFPIFENQDMKILRTPDFMAPSIPAGAMMPPPSFRDGVRTSMVYLTLSEELLDEHNDLGIPGMMIHEGIPGHHLQLATASLHPSIIRRHFDALEHAEGWTTMLEDYMLDQGYMGDLTDEARFIAKRDIARIGARVAIDLFFMTGDRDYLDVGTGVDVSAPDPFVAAGALLKAVTGFTDGRVQAELNWYSQERGYPLSYLTGNVLVWRLKADLKAAQADKLSEIEIDRLFHTIYLQSGNMPVSYLRKVFENKGLLA